MPNQFRRDMITEAILSGKFDPQKAYMLFGMIEQLESGTTFYEVVAELETTFAHAPDILDIVDLASAWIRERQDVLRILF